MKAVEGNARRGPSLTHRVDWVFQHENMPLMITGEYGHWRRVNDSEGLGGWMHYSLLSGVRTVLIVPDELGLLIRPYLGADAKAKAKRGVIARLRGCRTDWCEISSGGYRGWARKSDLWGVEKDEIRD